MSGPYKNLPKPIYVQHESKYASEEYKVYFFWKKAAEYLTLAALVINLVITFSLFKLVIKIGPTWLQGEFGIAIFFASIFILPLQVYKVTPKQLEKLEQMADEAWRNRHLKAQG